MSKNPCRVVYYADGEMGNSPPLSDSLRILLTLNYPVYLHHHHTHISLASLRVQLSDATFSGFSNKKAIGEFIIGSFLLYLSCLCLIG